MITVKAFEKGLICKGFQFQVGKTYEIPKVIVLKNGSYYSDWWNPPLNKIIEKSYQISENKQWMKNPWCG